jgi:transcriptional regulator with XRE-family HTH domain
MAEETRGKRQPARQAARPPGAEATRQGAGASVNAALGAELRTLRRALSLTSTDLARRAGLSAAMLSRIEAGTAAPSLGSLAALAEALGVPVARLFARHDRQRDCSYVPAGKGVRVNRQGSRAGHGYELLGHTLSGAVVVEPYIVTLDGDAKAHPNFQHTGTELLYMLRGRMTYRYQGNLFNLGPGDTLLFDANGIHGPEELLARPIVYLSAVMTPRL